MRTDIINFLKDFCKEWGLSANYVVEKDVYIIHKKGYAIQNFTTQQFYEIAKTARRKLLIGLLQRGLTHNLGEGNIKNNLNVNSQLGIRII